MIGVSPHTHTLAANSSGMRHSPFRSRSPAKTAWIGILVRGCVVRVAVTIWPPELPNRATQAGVADPTQFSVEPERPDRPLLKDNSAPAYPVESEPGGKGQRVHFVHKLGQRADVVPRHNYKGILGSSFASERTG